MAAESSLVSGIAGRYATALFELARDARSLDTVAADLARVQQMIADSPDLARLVRSPVFGRDEQRRAMAAVLERAGIGDLVRRFVGVVADNRRLFVLVGMIGAFQTLLARHRGETLAEVATATPLADAQLAAIRSALAQALGREVSVQSRVEPELIGGLVVKVGSRLVDGSIRAKLNNLKTVMKGVG